MSNELRIESIRVIIADYANLRLHGNNCTALHQIYCSYTFSYNLCVHLLYSYPMAESSVSATLCEYFMGVYSLIASYSS